MFAQALVIFSLPISASAAGDAASDHLSALLFIGLLIVVAKLAEGVLSRAGFSSIVAFTAAGVLLGTRFRAGGHNGSYQAVPGHRGIHILLPDWPGRNRHTRFHVDNSGPVFRCRHDVCGDIHRRLPCCYLRHPGAWTSRLAWTSITPSHWLEFFPCPAWAWLQRCWRTRDCSRS